MLAFTVHARHSWCLVAPSRVAIMQVGLGIWVWVWVLAELLHHLVEHGGELFKFLLLGCCERVG